MNINKILVKLLSFDTTAKLLIKQGNANEKSKYYKKQKKEGKKKDKKKLIRLSATKKGKAYPPMPSLNELG